GRAYVTCRLSWSTAAAHVLCLGLADLRPLVLAISVEDTFEKDVLLLETEPMIRRLAEKLWSASRKEPRIARTVVLKLKTSEFKLLTRSQTPDSRRLSCEELTDVDIKLRERGALGCQQG